MTISKISDNIFLKDDIYYVVKNDIVFAKSFSLEDMYSAKSILIKYNWNLSIIGEEVIQYSSGVFRVFHVENNLLKLVVKINENDVDYNQPKSSFVFLYGKYYFLIYDSKILGVFNSLNHAFIAETFLNNYSWDLSKLLYLLYYVSDYWVVINIENGILTFLYVSLMKNKVEFFLKSIGLNNISNCISPNAKKEFNFDDKKSNNKQIKRFVSSNNSNLAKNKSISKLDYDGEFFDNNSSNLNFMVCVYEDNSTMDFSYKKLTNLIEIDKFIFKKDNAFIVIKSNIFYGFALEKDGAYLIKNLLDQIDWDIKRLNDLNQIPYGYGYYWIINTSMGYVSCVASFSNYDDAYDNYNSFLSKMVYNFSSSNVSKITQKEISIIKQNNNFHLIRKFKGKTKLFGIFSTKNRAKIGKYILEKNNWNLNKIDENNCIFNVNDFYWVVNIKNDLLEICDNFYSYDEAYNFIHGIEYDDSLIDSMDDNLPVKIKSNELVRYDDLVFEKDNNFLVIKSDILYGISYSKKGIGVLKYLLDDINWDYHKFHTIGNIVYRDSYYWVMDFSNGYILCVDFFKDYDGALECFESKNFEKNIFIVDSGYDNVLISKYDGQYRLTAEFKGKELLFGIFPFKKYAEIAKLVLEKNNWNLNMISKDNIFFEKGSYWVINVVDNLLDVLGNFETYDEAQEYCDGINYDLKDMYLFLTGNENNNLDEKDNAISNIKYYHQSINKKVNSPIKKPINQSTDKSHKKSVKKYSTSHNLKKSSKHKINDYIYKIGDSYHIFNMIDGEFIHFGEFNSLTEANDYLELLMALNWKMID